MSVTRKDERVQKKTFGKWINGQLSSRGVVVTDLFYDLRDGNVLLDLLEVLTSRTLRREKGKLRVHHLSNAHSVLAILKENRVKLVNINNVDIVDGNPKITLALVWSIILHWQFKDVVRETRPSSSGLEKILLTWTRAAVGQLYPDIRNFGDSWKDGIAFCALVHRFRPDLFSWDDILRIKSCTARLDFIFDVNKIHLGVQRLLDPEDFESTPDKKSLMMYIMCLYEALPRDVVPLERIPSIESDSENSIIGSPFKTPVRNITEGIKYDGYCSVHEEIVKWLLDAEDKLNSMEEVSGDLTDIKKLFVKYKDYMEELDENQEAVGEILEGGCKILDDPNLTPFQEKDVRVRIKVLSDRWEALRVLAMNRQTEILERLMRLQKEKMKQFREWMTRTEDRISRMGQIGLNLEAVSDQIEEHINLQNDLEKQRTIVNSISNFIIADIGDSNASSNEQELEDQVAALEERWTHICVWIEERWNALNEVFLLWTKFVEEREVLRHWLDQAEFSLKEMERNPTEEMRELTQQVRQILTIHAEVETYQKRLSRLEMTAEELTKRLESETDEAQDNIADAVELLQDRWEILTEILEAQKQRINSFGINIEKLSLHNYSNGEDNSEMEGIKRGESADNATSSSSSTAAPKSSELDEENSTPKKRKITGSKRIQFETAYAKLSTRIQNRLASDFSEENPETDASIQSEADGTFELGRDLIREIISEKDFPPDYLENVRAKIKELESLWDSFQIQREYRTLKARFYRELDCIKGFLEVSKSLLESCEDYETLRRGKEAFVKHSETLDYIRRLSKEVTLCPGTLQDPSSTVKADLYSFCDQWELIESGFEAKETELIKRRKHALNDGKTDLGFNNNPEKLAELRKVYSETEEIEAWMNETDNALSSEDHKRSLSRFVHDLQILEKKIESINTSGSDLVSLSNDGSKARIFESYLKRTNDRWSNTCKTVLERHQKLKANQEKIDRISEEVGEINKFLGNIHKDFESLVSSESGAELTKPQELSQKTFKLLHFKDRIDKKRSILDGLLNKYQGTDEALELNKLVSKWESITDPILKRHQAMKNSSMDYGEFKSLAAQESDWLERLEKKLRKSTITTAADAEEISEALDDIENFIHNHSSNERLSRLEELAECLAANGLKFESVFEETKKLKARWEDLSKRAKEQTSVLEGHIAEAQEWEYKILSVQEWLAERDMLLSSHLEHELNVDDLPEETQAILREFEDHENLLSEMDEQVDAYRDAGKTEAASRLEDQLNLIHNRFQELAMKFELFQRQSTGEYSLRLDRVSRQLRDIATKLRLAELRTWDPEGVEEQLKDASCVYNALSDIKPEVENVIKMGRRLVSENVDEVGNEELSSRIDALKAEFNQVGSQITESKAVLEKALKLSEKLKKLMKTVDAGLPTIPEEPERSDDQVSLKRLKLNLLEMNKLREDVRSVVQIKNDLISMSLDGPIDDAFAHLRKRVDDIEKRWNEVSSYLKKCFEELKSSSHLEMSDISLTFLDLDKEQTVLKEGNSPLLAEFKSAFQEVSARIDSVEAKLFMKNRKEKSQDDEEVNSEDLGLEIESLRPEVSNLREMAIKLVVMFVGQKRDVEPEMRHLGKRWNEIVRAVEDRLAQKKEFKMVEVEEIKTTISHLRIPTPCSLVTKRDSSSLLLSPESEMDSEEIVTLPEDDDELSTSSSSSRIQSPLKRDETRKISTISFVPSSNKRIFPSRSEKVKVKVSLNTLPSPQKALKSPVTINQQINSHTPELAVLPFSSSSSSTSTLTGKYEEGSNIEDDDEAALAKDNEAIDKLLKDTNNHIEDLKFKCSSNSGSQQYPRYNSSYLGTAGYLEKEAKDFEAISKKMLSKIDSAKGKILDLDKEPDIRLRIDLIEMESHMIEAEVATLISRGDTLVLLTHRNDVKKAESLQSEVKDLRDSWADLRSLGERKKAHARTLESKLQEFKASADSLKAYLSSMSRKENPRKSPTFSRKKLELDHFNNLGATLKRQNVIGLMSLSVINAKWDEIFSNGTKNGSKEDRKITSKSSDSSREIVSILEKLVDAIEVVGRQLSTTVLSSTKRYENLSGQKKSLDTVKSAIERLGPTVRKTESDVEGINGGEGGMSVEYYDKVLVLMEKLREDWRCLTTKYSQRLDLWNNCSENYEKYNITMKSLCQWLETAEDTLKERPKAKMDIESQITDKQQDMTGMTLLGKEIMTRSSTEDALIIQGKVDDVLKRWKSLLSTVSQLRNGESSKKDSSWIDDALNCAYKPVNVSDIRQISEAVERLEKYHKELATYAGEENLENSPKVERLCQLLPKKISYLSERKSKLVKFKQKIKSLEVWVNDMSVKLLDASNQKIRGSRAEIVSRIRLAVIDKEYEVNRILNDFIIIEREVTSQEVDAELRRSVQAFKNKWNKLTGDSRRISAEGLLESPVIRNRSCESSIREIDSYSSVASPTSEVAFTTTTMESVASGTTYNASPLSEEVAPVLVTLEPSISELNIWLNSIESEVSQCDVPVHDNEAVKEQINLLQSSLNNLEIKRPFMDDLFFNSENLARDEDRIKAKVRGLRDHWEFVKRGILSRKTELLSMSTESDQYKRKSTEITLWLKRIEDRIKGGNGSELKKNISFDDMDQHIKSLLNIQKEIAKFHHHIHLFSQSCHRMSQVYAKDDTSTIMDFERSSLLKYEEMTNIVNKRLKNLHESKSELTRYDSSVQKFLAWLSETESTIENHEDQDEINPSKLREKLSQIKGDISSKDSEFASLMNTGEAMIKEMSLVESGMLRQRTDEMSSRMKSLQNRILNLSAGLHNGDEDSGGGVVEEDRTLLWIEGKRKGLSNMVLANNLLDLKKQLEENRALEEHIAERACRQECGRENSPESVDDLKRLRSEATDWKNKLNERVEEMKVFENDFESLTNRLAAAEETRSLWNEDSLLAALEDEEVEEDNNNDVKKAHLERIKDQVSSLEEGLVRLKTQAEKFSISKDGLSESTRRQLRNLEERIINLRNQLPNISSPPKIGAMREKCKTHNAKKAKDLPEGWERGFTEDDIPYYLNHENASTHWDHPLFSELLSSLKEMNSVQYSVYRLALKLRKIQQKLCLDLLDIEAAVIGFKELGLGPERHDCLIRTPEITSVLCSLLEAAKAEEPEEVDVELCSFMTLNWILNVYDPGRSGSVRVLALKIGVLLLTRGPLADKYRIFFELLADPEKEELSPQRLGLLLFDCLQVPKVLGEVASFGGSNVEPSVRSCFTMGISEGQRPPLSLNQDHFTKWLRREPQCLVWLPVLHRLAWAELAKHNAKCNICKAYPMIGFRYRCLKCFNFDLCHNCFFLGKTTKTHKSEHPMKEYCTSTGTSVNFKNFTSSLRNSFRTKKYFKKKSKQLCYLPVSSVLEGEDFIVPPLSPNSTMESKASNSLLQPRTLNGGKGYYEDEEDEEEGDEQGDSREPSNLKRKADLDEEHLLISKYCQILYQSSAVNTPECTRSESQQFDHGGANGDRVILDQVKSETKQCKRLEKRMKILESHNKQLEGQVQRLRELYQYGGGTLNSKSIIASNLDQSTTDIDTDSRGEDEEDEEQRGLNSPDSLNLSQHETTVVSD